MRTYHLFRVSCVSFVASIRRQVSILTVLLCLAAFGGLLLVSDWSAESAFANTVGFWNFNDGTAKNTLNNSALTLRTGSISGGTLNSGYASGSVANLPTGNSPYTLSVMMNTTTAGNLGMVGWGQFTVTDRCIAIRTINGQGTVANGNAFRHYWWVTD